MKKSVRIDKQNISSPNLLYSTNDKHQSAQNIIPFAAGRHDVSVSVAGGPNDPRLEGSRPKILTSQQLLHLQQSIAAYRQKISELSLATENFISSLQDLADCVPEAQIENPKLVSNLDFLIDSSQLIANANQTWAGNVALQVEAPLDKIIQDIPDLAKGKHDANRQKLKILIQQLHAEEDLSYRLKKKRSRDINAIQRSLHNRQILSEEIRRLSIQNENIHDVIAHDKVSSILGILPTAVQCQVQTFETVAEGLQKMGCEFNSSDTHTLRNNRTAETLTTNLSNPTPPGSKSSETEIFLPSPDKDLNMEFLLKAMANF